MKKLAFVLVAFLASSAYAADFQLDDGPNGPPGISVSGLNDKFTVLATELPRLNQIMSDTTDANIGLEKEAKVYLEDQKQKKAALDAAVAEEIRTVKVPLQQKMDAAASEYKARCARTFNREREMDQYNQCVADKARIEKENHDTIAWWESHIIAWNKNNTDPVNAVILKQNARIEQINSQVKENFKRFTDAQDRFIEVKKQIVVVLAQINQHCATKPPPAGGSFTYNEWVKWCSNVDWDGASRKLPPMYKWQGN